MLEFTLHFTKKGNTMQILAFFLAIMLLVMNFGCSKPLANPNLAYPKIIYDKDRDTHIIPVDFSRTFENRFKILYATAPNPALKEVRFYFSDFINNKNDDFRIVPNNTATPSYDITLHIEGLFDTHNTSLEQSYVIPIMTFNPPYTQNFDGLILKLLEE